MAPACLILDKADVCFQRPKVQHSWMLGVCWGDSHSHRLLFCTNTVRGVSQGSNLLRTHSSQKRGLGNLGVTGNRLILEPVWGCGRTGDWLAGGQNCRCQYPSGLHSTCRSILSHHTGWRYMSGQGSLALQGKGLIIERDRCCKRLVGWRCSQDGSGIGSRGVLHQGWQVGTLLLGEWYTCSKGNPWLQSESGLGLVCLQSRVIQVVKTRVVCGHSWQYQEGSLQGCYVCRLLARLRISGLRRGIQGLRVQLSSRTH